MSEFEPDRAGMSTTGPEPGLLDKPLGFGVVFTEHMAVMDWDEVEGWHGGRMCDYGPLGLHAGAAVLHYGQAVFEGLKAFRQPDGEVALFRPHDNARRFQRSAARIAMPELPIDVFIEALEAVARVDRAWVPGGRGRSLYLRPFMVASEQTLAVRAARRYVFCVIASPVDGFFASVDPITVWPSMDLVRAAPGGTGAVKFAGNYAGSMLAQRQATERGCDQVVWLDARERSTIEEMGAMNIFFVEAGADGPVLVTPPLAGTQLEGVTRDSILRIAETVGYGVSERSVTLDEWRDGCASGRFTEAFACGTAAAVTPIGAVRTADDEFAVGDRTLGPVTELLRERLLGLQHGLLPDSFGWLHRVA